MSSRSIVPPPSTVNNNVDSGSKDNYALSLSHTIKAQSFGLPRNLLQVTDLYAKYGARKVVVLGQPHIVTNIHEDKEPWYVIDRCVDCGRSFSRIEDDWSRYNYCGRHPIVPDDVEWYEMQSGEEVLNLRDTCNDFIQRLALIAKVKDLDSIIREMEGLVLLWLNIVECSTTVGIFSSVSLYIRGNVKGSLANTVLDFVKDIFDQPTMQGGPEETDSLKNFFSNVKTQWKVCRNNGFFNHFSRLMGVLVVCGICNASNLSFSLGSYKVFEPEILDKHRDAPSLVDAIFSTVLFFTERMVACFKDRSLLPLFAPTDDTDLDVEYAFILSAWTSLKSGNLKKVHGISEHEFDQRLTRLTRKIRDLASTVKGFERKILTDKLTSLAQVQNDFVTFKVHSGLRRAPFTIEVHGLSSQGKTTFASQLVDCLLASAGLPTDSQYRATHNASDRYWSSWSSDKLALTIDDFANEKPEMMETAPGRVLIDVCNNTPFYATKADLESKGKAFVEPEIVVVTTNVKDLCAYQLSNCPYSLQRRPHVVIEVQAKSEFQYAGGAGNQGIDAEKVRNAKNNTPTDDIWTLKVERAVQPKNINDVASYGLLSDEEGPLKDVDFARVARYVTTAFHKHRNMQAQLVVDMMTRSNGIPMCSHPGCVFPKHICKEHCGVPEVPVDTNVEGILFQHRITGEERILTPSDRTEILSGMWYQVEADEDQAGLENATSGWKSLFMSPSDMIDTAQSLLLRGVARNSNRLNSVMSYSALSTARYFYNWFDWMQFVPTPCLRNRYVQNILIGMHGREMHRNFLRGLGVTALCSLGMMGLFTWKNVLPQLPMKTIVGSGWLISNACRYKHLRYHTWMEIVERNTINPVLQKIRDATMSNALRTSTVLFTLYLISRTYCSMPKDSPQAALDPETVDEVKQRDAQKNPWASIVRKPLPSPEQCKTTTRTQLDDLVRKNLCYATVLTGEDKYRVNVLFLRTGVIAIPKHYFLYGDQLDLQLRNENPNSLGGVLHTSISKERAILLPNTDLAICYISSGGSRKDITPWLVDEVSDCTEIYMQWRDKEGVVLDAHGLSSKKLVSHGEQFLGGRYENLTIKTFTGLCGAVLTTNQGGAKIYGMHVGGVSNTTRGCCVFLPTKEILASIDSLQSIPGVVLAGNSSEFHKQCMGSPIRYDSDPHGKSCIRFLPEGSQIQFYGSSGESSTSYTSVKVTPISEHVMDVMGAPNIYCAPKMRPEWFGWQKCLANLSHPGRDMPSSLLHRAVLDYGKPIFQICRSTLWNDTAPLEYYDNVCGVPGKRFLDPIKLDTSPGIPLKGVKRDYVVELEPTKAHPNLHRFTDEIDDEILRIENLYANGLRANTIAKACKKDEILSKADKCRIFYGNPIALTFLVRKYYLPLIRILQMHPLTSECAVGINCYGPEWQTFQDHALHFGKDRIIGGDYSKYDQKLPSQLLMASFWVLIEMAKCCNYSQRDIRVMRAMVADIVYAYIHFDGNLISLSEGGHISGNSLTVILNGICGSLNMRCAFFERFDADFRDHVKLMTYGDDNIGSASRESGFTITMISDFLARYGQDYTMPDKESQIQDYLPYDEFEFLKRKNVYCPKRGMHTGALVEKSIFKTLHCFMREKKSELSQEMACALNVDTALREWFHHGEIVYEQRRKELLLVAERSCIRHLTTRLDFTYDECVGEWKENYM